MLLGRTKLPYFCAMLKVKNLFYSYDPEIPVLKGISFEIGEGDHLCVMGESGCGKSTLLKGIYGLLDLDEGEIFWKEKQVLGPAYNLVPGMPFFKYVAQDNDLMPFTSVADNVSKYLSRIDMEGAKRRTDELLEVIGMSEFREKKVKDLSGGQKQRVALARALALDPELLLLDEPFSQVDNFKKNSLRRTLFNYLKDKGIACVVATHDSEDALSFADKMLVIQHNKQEAFAAPADLFKNPPGKYVASLFDDVNEVEVGGKKTLLYPDQIQIVNDSEKNGRVLRSYFKGSHWLIEIQYQEQLLYVNHSVKLPEQMTVSLNF